MVSKSLQAELKNIEQELRDLKTSQKFCGNVDCYEFDKPNSTKKMRIYYDNPMQRPITTWLTTEWDYYSILGKYDSATKSQLVFFERNHNEVVFYSTQPIKSVEDV